MTLVKRGLSTGLAFVLAFSMLPISHAFAAGNNKTYSGAVDIMHPFTGTDDLIRSAVEELSKKGVTKEEEKRDAAHVERVEAAAGLTYDEVVSSVSALLTDQLAEGMIDVHELNLSEEDMAQVMSEVLYGGYLYNAITDIKYIAAEGKVAQVTFVVSEGYVSAMDALSEDSDPAVIEEAAENAAKEMAGELAADTSDSVPVTTWAMRLAEEVDSHAESACVSHTVDANGVTFDFEKIINVNPAPVFDAEGNVLNGGLIYDAANRAIVQGLLPEVYYNLTGISFTCAECGESIDITDAEILAQSQASYEIYYDLTTGAISQVPSASEQPQTSDTFIHYTQMQVATYADDTLSVIGVDEAGNYIFATDENGNPIGVYSGTRDNGAAQVEFYYSQLSAFNADHAEYFGVSTDYWTSKNTAANPMAALKVLCNLDPNMDIPPAQMLQMVQMLPQAFMAYVYYYGGELLAMRDACMEVVAALPAGATDVQKLLVIHDWLAENAVFDMGSMLTIAGESSGNDPIQMTTFGALLSNQLTKMTNSNYYGGICLAYAAAYTYLVQAAYPDLYTDGSGNWIKPADVDAKGGDIVDFSQVMFYADTAETSIAGEGFGGDLFNNVHYFNAVKLPDAPTSSNADDAMTGNWFYVDSCYDDIYIECLSQYRAEAEGSVYHTYFLVSPQTMAKLWADSIDYIDSLYDGYTYVAQVDEYGNVTTPSDNVSADHPDYDPTHPEYVKVENPNEVKNDNTCYEESWFSGAVSKIYHDGANWYYVDSGSSISSQSGMLNDNGEFDIDTDQMEQNGLNLDGLMHSNRVGVESQDVMKSRPVSAPDYWVAEEDDSNYMGFDMTTKEDPHAAVLFDYGTGKFSTNEEIDLNAAVVEDFIYNEQYPGLTHSIGLYEGVIYFNLGNQIYAYDVANAACELFKEYNTVSATSDGRPFTASSYTMDEAGTALTVEDNPIAALCVRTAYTPLYNYVDADGNVVIDLMGNVNGDPGTIVGQVYQMMYAAPTMTVNIGTNYTFTYPDSTSGYTAEAINLNPDYNMGMGDEGVNKNDEFLWCANIREDVAMTDWVAVEAGESAVPCTAQNSGHAYVYNADEDAYICSECNLHAVNIAAESEYGVITMTSIPESGMSEGFIGNNGGSTTTEPVSPEREAATVQSGVIIIAVDCIENYGLSELSYCYEGGESVVITPNENGVYAIEKEEAGCLTVSAVYEEAQTLEGLTVEVAEATYTGDPQQPVLTIVDGEAVLVEGADYIITSEAQTNAGTYQFTLAGAGEYEGEYVGEWTISRATYDMSGISFADVTVTYDGNPQPIAVSGDLPEGLVVTYEGNDKVDVGTYEVKAVFEADANHEPVEGMTAALKIVPADLSAVAIAAIPAQTWTGSVIEPKLSLEFNGILLVEGEDFDVFYVNNVDIGSAAVTAVGLGNFTGSIEVPFKILDVKGAWENTPSGWKYKNPDGTYAADCWKDIDGVRYHFDASGVMTTGWLKDGDNWYWLKSSGAMAANEWLYDGGVWYHFDEAGAMQTGWVEDGGVKYYMKASGAMAANEWVSDGAFWYHFASSGAMQTGWLNDGGTWYYLKDSGVMAAYEWVNDGGTWYWLKASGAMAANEWVEYGGDWYYLKASGAMATNQWIGGYYVGSDGRWI